jgi:outer membrane murein-binding lipoprotein Lpp
MCHKALTETDVNKRTAEKKASKVSQFRQKMDNLFQDVNTLQTELEQLDGKIPKAEQDVALYAARKATQDMCQGKFTGEFNNDMETKIESLQTERTEGEETSPLQNFVRVAEKIHKDFEILKMDRQTLKEVIGYNVAFLIPELEQFETYRFCHDFRMEDIDTAFATKKCHTKCLDERCESELDCPACAKETPFMLECLKKVNARQKNLNASQNGRKY